MSLHFFCTYLVSVSVQFCSGYFHDTYFEGVYEVHFREAVDLVTRKYDTLPNITIKADLTVEKPSTSLRDKSCSEGQLQLVCTQVCALLDESLVVRFKLSVYFETILEYLNITSVCLLDRVLCVELYLGNIVLNHHERLAD